MADEKASNIIFSRDAEEGKNLLPRRDRWYVMEKVQMLSTVGAENCPTMTFVIEHPEGRVSILVEVLGPFFVISRVVSGLLKD